MTIISLLIFAGIGGIIYVFIWGLSDADEGETCHHENITTYHSRHKKQCVDCLQEFEED